MNLLEASHHYLPRDWEAQAGAQPGWRARLTRPSEVLRRDQRGAGEGNRLHMRAPSIVSFMVRVSIVLAVVCPSRARGEQPAFRLELSQPEYGSRAGGTWTCTAEQLQRSKCRHVVPLVIFGEPSLVQIEVGVDLMSTRVVELYASLDRPVALFRANGGKRRLVLKSDGSLTREIRLDYVVKRGEVTHLVFHPSPQELLGLTIAPDMNRH